MLIQRLIRHVPVTTDLSSKSKMPPLLRQNVKEEVLDGLGLESHTCMEGLIHPIITQVAVELLQCAKHCFGETDRMRQKQSLAWEHMVCSGRLALNQRSEPWEGEAARTVPWCMYQGICVPGGQEGLLEGVPVAPGLGK